MEDNYKIITIFGSEYEIIKSWDNVICIIPTGANVNRCQEPFGKIEIIFGQKLIDFKILKSGSAVFRLPEDENVENYYVTAFPIMFAPYDDTNANIDYNIFRCSKIEEELNILKKERKTLLESIKKCSEEKIKF